jgi:hypothetical protein
MIERMGMGKSLTKSKALIGLLDGRWALHVQGGISASQGRPRSQTEEIFQRHREPIEAPGEESYGDIDKDRPI